MYYFRWLPGRTAARFVKIHRPDICLPASGMTMTRDNGIRLLTVGSIAMPIRSYRFENNGVPLHIFYCYWDARSSYESEAAANEEDWTVRGRLRAAWRGRREAGAQMLEVVVWNYDNDADATAALQRQLEEIVRKGLTRITECPQVGTSSFEPFRHSRVVPNPRGTLRSRDGTWHSTCFLEIIDVCNFVSRSLATNAASPWSTSWAPCSLSASG